MTYERKMEVFTHIVTFALILGAIALIYFNWGSIKEAFRPLTPAEQAAWEKQHPSPPPQAKQNDDTTDYMYYDWLPSATVIITN